MTNALKKLALAFAVIGCLAVSPISGNFGFTSTADAAYPGWRGGARWQRPYYVRPYHRPYAYRPYYARPYYSPYPPVVPYYDLYQIPGLSGW